MSSPAQSRPPARARVGGAIFEGLEREWRRAVRSRAMQAEALAWSTIEPALQGASADDIIARVTWDGYRPSVAGAVVLSALLRQATDPRGARALLQALLPRIRAENVCTPMYGHGIAENWQRPGDTVADFVAECFSVIKRHAGENRADVDRLVVQEAARKLRTARQVQRRYQARTVALAPGHCARVPADLLSARSVAELLATAVLRAVKSGQLSSEEARLLYATRVKGLAASEAGRRQGMAPKAVYHALARAERALLVGMA
jgi:hypothetical protein